MAVRLAARLAACLLVTIMTMSYINILVMTMILVVVVTIRMTLTDEASGCLACLLPGCHTRTRQLGMQMQYNMFLFNILA